MDNQWVSMDIPGYPWISKDIQGNSMRTAPERGVNMCRHLRDLGVTQVHEQCVNVQTQALYMYRYGVSFVRQSRAGRVVGRRDNRHGQVEARALKQ
eukprot:1724366-Prymnesium_polylepis.1